MKAVGLVIASLFSVAFAGTISYPDSFVIGAAKKPKQIRVQSAAIVNVPTQIEVDRSECSVHASYSECEKVIRSDYVTLVEVVVSYLESSSASDDPWREKKIYLDPNSVSSSTLIALENGRIGSKAQKYFEVRTANFSENEDSVNYQKSFFYTHEEQSYRRNKIVYDSLPVEKIQFTIKNK